MVGTALLVSAGVGIASYFIGSATVDHMTQQQMQTVATERTAQFTTYLESIEADLVNSAIAESVQTTLRDLTIAWGGFTTLKPVADPVETLRGAYIDDNPNPAGERQACSTARRRPRRTTTTSSIPRFIPIFAAARGARLLRPLSHRCTGEPALLGDEAGRLRHQPQ
jgi:hypothetical protein